MKIDTIKRKDVITVILLFVCISMYHIISLIPKEIKSIDFYFFKIGSFGFYDMATFAHYTKMKILILILSLIWYFTCRHWWKTAILIATAIELVKLISILSNTTNAMDEIDYIVSLPITIPMIIGLILISTKINKYNSASKLRSEIDIEIDQVFFSLSDDKRHSLSLLEKKYNEEKINKSSLNTIDYLKKLISLRNEFYKL